MADVLPIRPRLAEESSFKPPVPDREVPPPPEGLSEESARLWTNIVRQWVVEDDALALLQMGLEARDRHYEAAEILRRDGPVVVNPKSGAVRQHPCHAIARDNLTAFRQCFRQLRLEPPGT